MEGGGTAEEEGGNMIVDPDFPHHHKTVMLAGLLRTPLAGMYVIQLWCFCQARKTDLVQDDPFMLAQICGFKGNPDNFRKAMIQAKWLETESDGMLRVHGWSERNIGLAVAREASKKAVEARAKRRLQKEHQKEDQKEHQKDNQTIDHTANDRIGRDRIGVPPNPQRVILSEGGSVQEFLEELLLTGKFPNLTDMTVQGVIDCHPDWKKHWQKVVDEARSMPDHLISNPKRWLIAALGRYCEAPEPLMSGSGARTGKKEKTVTGGSVAMGETVCPVYRGLK